MYLEGDTSQSECLEISLGSLHRTQDESLLVGTNVVLSVTVKWTHTGAETGEYSGYSYMSMNKVEVG